MPILQELVCNAVKFKFRLKVISMQGSWISFKRRFVLEGDVNILMFPKVILNKIALIVC